MLIRELITTGEIIDALGGTATVHRLTGVSMQAVSNWRKAETFPPDTYVILNQALAARGLVASLRLWAMRTPPADAACAENSGGGA